MKMMLTILTLTLGLGTARAADADLIGNYAIMDRGAWKMFMKVSVENGQYIVSEKHETGMWQKSKQPLATVSRVQFEKLLNHKFSASFDGLANNVMAVFKVPADFQVGGFKIRTGYFIVYGFGPIEVRKL
jgi:hypothetical protein